MLGDTKLYGKVYDVAKRTTIWIVETGAYSDRYVVNAFTTEEAAKEYCALGEGDYSAYDMWDGMPHRMPWFERRFLERPYGTPLYTPPQQSTSTEFKDADDDEAAAWGTRDLTVLTFESDISGHSLRVAGPTEDRVNVRFEELLAAWQATQTTASP